jgi:hypothetical protein
MQIFLETDRLVLRRFTEADVDDGDHGEDQDEDSVEPDVVESITPRGEPHLREGGAHPCSGVGKLSVASGDTDYE